MRKRSKEKMFNEINMIAFIIGALSTVLLLSNKILGMFILLTIGAILNCYYENKIIDKE